MQRRDWIMWRRGPKGGQRGRSGFLAMEMVIGLMLIVVLSTVLVVVATQHRRAADALAASRERVRLAEQVMTEMQAGRGRRARADQAAHGGAEVAIRPVETSSPVAGYVWVEVKVTSRGHGASLTGLVPAESVPTAAGPTTSPTRAGGQS